MATCTVEALTAFIRENAADCLKDKKKRSDEYVKEAICLAVQQVVKDKSDDFQETVKIKLDNGTEIQSSCDECSGLVDIVGAVEGPCGKSDSCNSPIKRDRDNDDSDTYYRSIYSSLACTKEGEDECETFINNLEFEILGDGGCEFLVCPSVPDSGDYFVHVLCVVLPDIENGEIPEQLCRHFYLVALMALFWIYTYEADPAMQAKAVLFQSAYYKALDEDRDVNRDIFLESIKFGTRTSEDD